MFLIWTVYIFQLFVLVHNQKTTKFQKKVDPITKLRKSIFHVIALLDDMDMRIYEQRKRLKQMGIDRRRGGGDASISDEAPSLRRAQVDVDAVLNSLFREDAPRSRIQNSTCVPQPKLGLKLKKIMLDDKVGYFHAALIGIAEILSDREEALKAFSLAFGQTMLRMSSEGDLAVLGDSLLFYLKLLWVSVFMTPKDTVLDSVIKLQAALEEKNTMSAEVLKIIKDYDSFFTTTEGETLFRNLEGLHDFIQVNDDSELLPVLRRTLESMLAPAKRNKANSKIKEIMASTYKICQKYFPNLMSMSIDNVIEAVSMKHKAILNKTRRNSVKDIQSELRRLIGQSNESPNVPEANVTYRVLPKPTLKQQMTTVSLNTKQFSTSLIKKGDKMNKTTEKRTTKNNVAGLSTMNTNKKISIRTSSQIPNKVNQEKSVYLKNENKLRRNNINVVNPLRIESSYSYSNEEGNFKSMLFKAMEF